jgi:hypothetical protein
MDLTALQEILKTDEGKAWLDQTVEERVAEKTKGILEKNAALLSEAKAAKAKADEAEREREAAKEEAILKSGDIEKITAKYKADIDKHLSEKASVEKQLRGLVVEEGLTAALVKVGVAAPLLPAAKALLEKQGIDMLMDNGRPIATVGGKSLQDFVSGWATGDEGKHFVSAAVNSGGGSGGANASAGGASGEIKTSVQRIASGLKGGQLT